VLYRHQGRQASTTFASQQEAKRFVSLIDALDVDRALALLDQEQQGQTVPLDEIAAEWFAWKARDLTPRALADYRRDYDNWIAPHLGRRAAVLITETDVQEWVDKILAPQLSPKTVADRHALLHGIYKWASAKKRGMVPDNPCLETDLPKRTKKAAKGLTLPEWLALKDAAYRVDPDAADLILFLASTGWRIGEATALMPLGIDDLGAGQMYVEMTHVNRKGSGVVAGAKSEAGLRRIRIINDECRAMLRRRLIGLRAGDYVFTNSHSPTGLWEPSTFRNRWWRKAVVEAGLEGRHPTPHWLRHTHVMLCHLAGMSLPEIQRRIGHEDIKTTINVYGRMIDDMSDEVAERLDALLSGRGLPVLGEVVTEHRELG
jgi:integrase